MRSLSHVPGLPRLPAVFTAAALLYWGWQQQHLVLAVMLATVLGIAVAVPWRWPFERRDCHRVCDLCGLILVGFALLSWRDFGLAHGFIRVLSWLPLLLFLLPLTQALRVPSALPIASLFAGLRSRERDPVVGHDYGEADISYPYMIACLLAAACGREPGTDTAIAVGLIVLALWPAARWKCKPAAWLLAMSCVLGTALAANNGLRILGDTLEPIATRFFDAYFWRNRDPFINRTALGSVTSFKRSERILARVHAESGQRVPALLREATYSTFQYGNWLAADGEFQTVEAEQGETGKTWVLGEGPRADERTRISMRFKDDTVTVPVPLGTRHIERVDAAEVKTNRYGAVRLELHPGWVGYQTAYRSYWSSGDLPRPEDRKVPAEHQSDLARFATELGLYGLEPRAAIQRMNTYFIENFRYSLKRRWPRSHSRIHDFLFLDRSGHCEYFATTATLLLRELGIPTRYGVGFAVREYSPLELRYVVRARHAHAWTMAWLDGRWESIDPTPPSLWAEEDTEFALRPLLDLYSLLSFWISPEARIRDEIPWLNRLLALLLLPLIALLAYSLLRRPRIRQSHRRYQPAPDLPGADSEFYRALQRLEKRYGPRPAGETLARWLSRHAPLQGPIRAMLRLHYRLRFDPAGLSQTARARLRRLVSAWLARTTRLLVLK